MQAKKNSRIALDHKTYFKSTEDIIIRMKENKPFKILSIDGGGIKGLYSASILKRLEEKSKKKSGDCFDMICGTSTGGIIALGLASGKEASDLVDLYNLNGNKIFPTAKYKIFRFFQKRWNGAKQVLFWGKFSAKPLTRILKENFGTTTLGELNNLVCIPSFNLISGMPRVFKFPHKEGGFFMDKKTPLVDAALATSAAPTYLPIHNYKDTLYIDGGVWANNPYQCKVCEGDKMVQSENGNKLIECPNCEGKGNYKPYDTN